MATPPPPPSTAAAATSNEPLAPAATQPLSLPERAVPTIADHCVTLVLHGISFSHYVERTRWTLRLLGLPFDEVMYLPLQHMLPMIGLRRAFGAAAAPTPKATASSKSPAATPALAIYSASGEPLCLLQDSAVICRYAALRAAALKLPAAPQLYGAGLALAAAPGPAQPATAAEAEAKATARQEGGVGGSSGSTTTTTTRARAIVGGDARVAELEQRLLGPMGVETRRVAYFHLLPATRAGASMFAGSISGGSTLGAWLSYAACRILLPRLLRITAASAATGRERLRREFDVFDALLLEQQQQQQAGPGASLSSSSSSPRLPFYLTGSELTAADIALACLAAPVLSVPPELCAASKVPPHEQLPRELAALCEELRGRPTGRFVLDMWRVHGPRAAAGAVGGAGGGGGASRQHETTQAAKM